MAYMLDDIWLDKIGKLGEFSLTRKRRIYRVMVVLAIGISYLIDMAILCLFSLVGTVPSSVPLIFGLAATGHIVLFSTLHWTGFSERFANPHMTAWQMAYAIAVQLAFMTIAPQIAYYFLGIVIVIFGFASLRISLRDSLIAWFLACLSIAGVLTYFKLSTLGITSPNFAVDTVVWIAFSTILLRLIGLGHYSAMLKARWFELTNTLKDEVQNAELLASHDALTDALNRHAILPAISEEISLVNRAGMHACLIMIDIDRFKLINDNFGHPVGDVILVKLCDRIRTLIRDSDRLGRYGGEEFILLLPATNIDQGINMCERIREDIASAPWNEIAAGVHVTISCGITEIHPFDTRESAIERADSALYDAKNNGRNRVSMSIITQMHPDNTE